MVEGGGLENRCPVMSGTVGSNPTPSANMIRHFLPRRDGRVGLRRSPAKRVCGLKLHHGFESHSLRHLNNLAAPKGGFFVAWISNRTTHRTTYCEVACNLLKLLVRPASSKTSAACTKSRPMPIKYRSVVVSVAGVSNLTKPPMATRPVGFSKAAPYSTMKATRWWPCWNVRGWMTKRPGRSGTGT